MIRGLVDVSDENTAGLGIEVLQTEHAGWPF